MVRAWRASVGAIQDFLRLESAGGIVLVACAALALIADNSPLAAFYDRLLDLKFGVQLGELTLTKPILLWINDGLMAVFFLLVGLEIKRELVEGELSTPAQAAMPAVAAAAGMLVPAGIFWLLNHNDAAALRGWAIPSATDIAFSLGVLSLLGKRVPVSLKITLMAIAVLDDLGAIVVIAIFYTADLSLLSLILALAGLAALALLNFSGVRRIAPYMLVGIFVWICVLKSGVHATLAGVALAMAIPLKADADGHSPLHEMVHALHPWVAFAIMPLFAFANAGVSFAGLTFASFSQPVALGIGAGLFLGKQLGIFLAIYALVALGLARRPEGASWPMVYGMALLCGIGFTMSLFIGTLAYEDDLAAAYVRLGVLGGSILSAIAGYGVLRLCRPAQ